MRAGAGLLLVATASLLGGCVYFNSLYNAQRIFEEAEQDRRAGRETEARARYDSVVSKAARSYRKDPDGSWADDALYLLGRTYLRQGRLVEARAALERTMEITDDWAMRRGADLHLGIVTALTGDREQGLWMVDRALPGIPAGPLREEGRLWRARILLAEGRTAEGWGELERVGRSGSRIAVPAALERVVWGIARNDRRRAREGLERLLASDAGHVKADTLRSLVREAAEVWGPEEAAKLLETVDAAPWPPRRREGLLLLRARLHLQAGDTSAAVVDARTVADGVGGEATRARLLLARLRLADVEVVGELDEVRPVLLPAVGDPRVLELLEALRKVEVLERKAEGEQRPVALFAAGELSRDVLNAPRLARSLLLRYADETRGPWTGKALMAALALTDDRARRAVILLRLEAMEANPYVRAARMGWVGAARFRELESTLREELRRVLSEVAEEVAQLDVLVRERSDTVP